MLVVGYHDAYTLALILAADAIFVDQVDRCAVAVSACQCVAYHQGWLHTQVFVHRLEQDVQTVNSFRGKDTV